MTTTSTPYAEFTLPGTRTSFRMLPVPGGTFRMGASKDPASKLKIHHSALASKF